MQNSRELAATVVGAVIGGAVGYLFFTDHGRALRRQMEPALNDIARDLTSLRSTLQKAAGTANEGWQLLNEALGEADQRSPYSSPHQTSPF